MKDFIIDDEIQSLLTPLEKDEHTTLESLILDGLHVDPLVLLKINGEATPILGDGHNRKNICEKHGIPFTTRTKKVDTREDAIQWVIDNQLGRRNLTDERRAYYRGKEYISKAKSRGKPDNSATVAELGETAKTVAEKHDVSPRTIENNAAFAKAVDKLPEKEKEAVLNGHSGQTKKAITEGKKPILCHRCQRVGATKDCQSCIELRSKKKPATEPKKPKAGKPIFDDRQVGDLIGKLARLFDSRAHVYGKGPKHQACIVALDKVLAAFHQWQVENR